MEQQRNNHHQGFKVFVGGLPHGITDDEFEAYFKAFGTIEDIIIIHNKETRVCRGFGFVTYENEESSNAVLQNQFHKIKDKLVEVKKALPKTAKNNTSSTNTYTTVPQIANNPNYLGLARNNYYPYYAPYNHYIYSQHYFNYDLYGYNGYVAPYNCYNYYNCPYLFGSPSNDPNPIVNSRLAPVRINSNSVRITTSDGEAVDINALAMATTLTQS